MDVKTAFLNGELDEEIYMKQPTGFVMPGNEAEWLRNLINEIPLWPKPTSPISIRCDSEATFAKAYNQVYNGKSRQLGVRHNMVRELIMHGVISVKYVVTQQNLADRLTKGLSRDLVKGSTVGLGYSPSENSYVKTPNFHLI
jgi:hypothetical protein